MRWYGARVFGDAAWEEGAHDSLMRIIDDLTKRDVTTSRVGVRNATADQLLRSVASVSANVGEGYPRVGRRKFDLRVGRGKTG